MARYLMTSTSETVGGVFLVDSRTGAIRRILSGSYRGMTRGRDGFYVVSGTRNRPNDPNLVHRATIYRITPETWATEKIIEHPIGDAHDLRWVEDSFYLVSSVGNQIIRLDEQCRVVDRMQVVEDERDTCHVNCLMQAGGSMYCSVFTLSPGDRKEKRLLGIWQSDGKVLRIDYPGRSFEVVAGPLSQPHSLVARDGQIYLTESHSSQLTQVDPASGDIRRLMGFYGFLRGLAFSQGEAVVGVSPILRKERRKFRRLPPLLNFLESLRPFSGVLVLDPETWKVRRRLREPGCEPYEILPVDEAE